MAAGEDRSHIGPRSIRARSFGSVAGEYDRGRPGYAAEAISWLLGDRPRDVLDVGAGTGKLTAALLEAGHRVTCVEPLPEMLAILSERLPGALALAGSAEELPVGDSSFDAVVVGSAFHWFDQERALAQVRRVLRPSGTLGLLGNSFDVSVPWVARVREILGRPAIQRPGHWPAPQVLSAMFAEVLDRELPHRQTIDLPALRDLALSRSTLAILSAAERASELERIDRLWASDPELAGRSSAELPWVTRARRCWGML